METITIENKDSGITLEAYNHDRHAEVYISRHANTDKEETTSLILNKETGMIEISGRQITTIMWETIKNLMDQPQTSG